MTATDNDTGLGTFGELHLTLGRLDDRMSDLDKALRRQPTQPIYERKRSTGAFPSSGILVLDLGGPKEGSFWYVRKWAAGGLTPTTAAAGRADLFVSGGDLRFYTSLAQLDMADWEDAFSSLPNLTSQGRGELVARYPERLFVVISSGTTTQQYVASCRAERFEQAAIKEDWAV